MIQRVARSTDESHRRAVRAAARDDEVFDDLFDRFVFVRSRFDVEMNLGRTDLSGHVGNNGRGVA